MSVINQGRKAIKKMVFGDTLLPQEFTVGMLEPHAEIAVWLHGARDPIDVTCRQSSVCSDPFTIGISFRDRCEFNQTNSGRLSLKFCERNGTKRVLGEIGLRQTECVSLPDMELMLFQARSAANRCLPAARLCANYLLQAYAQWRGPNTSGMKMSFLDRRAAMVSFIRPHPVMLVSVAEEAGGNIFPMNIMGELGCGRYAFGLKDSRRAAHLVERLRRVALSSVPLSQAPVAFGLAVNHFKDSIVWEELPFATRTSTAFKIPVPAFTQRVREMEIENVHRLGSHTLFIARLVHEEKFAETAELCVIHGFYQAWRLRKQKSELAKSVIQDSLHKGLYPGGEPTRAV